MAQAAKASPSQSAPVNPAVQTLMSVIQKRRSVRVYKSGKVSDAQLNTILEAARWAPSGANTQPWEFVVTSFAAAYAMESPCSASLMVTEQG